MTHFIELALLQIIQLTLAFLALAHVLRICWNVLRPEIMPVLLWIALMLSKLKIKEMIVSKFSKLKEKKQLQKLAYERPLPPPDP